MVAALSKLFAAVLAFKSCSFAAAHSVRLFRASTADCSAALSTLSASAVSAVGFGGGVGGVVAITAARVFSSMTAGFTWLNNPHADSIKLKTATNP